MKKVALMLIAGMAGPVFGQSADDIKQEIIDRCRQSMSEHGAAIVKACVDQDIEAYNALVEYPDKYDSIVNRCINDMRGHGWAIVKACADQDIEAEQALQNY